MNRGGKTVAKRSSKTSTGKTKIGKTGVKNKYKNLEEGQKANPYIKKREKQMDKYMERVEEEVGELIEEAIEKGDLRKSYTHYIRRIANSLKLNDAWNDYRKDNGKATKRVKSATEKAKEIIKKEKADE